MADPSEAYNENLIRVSKNPRCTLYGRRDEKTTRWNSKEAIIQYRQSWEKHMNQALKEPDDQNVSIAALIRNRELTRFPASILVHMLLRIRHPSDTA